MSAYPDKPRLRQTILLIIPLLAIFGWELIGSVVAWNSFKSVSSSDIEAAYNGNDDGAPDQNLFRKPVILFRSAASGDIEDAPVPPEDEGFGPEGKGCGRGLAAAGSNADCRAPPFAG